MESRTGLTDLIEVIHPRYFSDFQVGDHCYTNPECNSEPFIITEMKDNKIFTLLNKHNYEFECSYDGWGAPTDWTIKREPSYLTYDPKQQEDSDDNI